MKKLLYFALTGATYYLAGMYRNRTLLILFCLEVMLGVIMLILSRIFKRSISADFIVQNDVTVRENTSYCRIWITKKGILPVTRFCVKFRPEYPAFGKNAGSKKQGSVIRHTQKLYGGCRSGGTQLSFYVRAPLCGLLRIRMDSLRVYDYLTLFSSKKKLNKEMMIVVFPKPCSLTEALAPLSYGSGEQSSEQVVLQKGMAKTEISQIREYNPGDASRYIHWNQSARLGDLYVKEFQKNTDLLAELLLDTSCINEKNPVQVSRFYEILYTLIMEFLKREFLLSVGWPDEKTQTFFSENVSDERAGKEMMLKLYQTEFAPQHKALRQSMLDGYKRKKISDDGCYMLDTDLNLWFGNTLLARFTQENI